MPRLLACLPLAAPLAVLVLVAPAVPAEDRKAPAFEMTDDEKALLALTNAERAKQKLPPLAPNPILFKVARLHSANMAKQEKMEHVLDGKDPAARTLAGGYDFRKVMENIAQEGGLAKDDKPQLEGIMERWMKSKVHRDNILGNGLEEIGLGIIRTDKGEVYYTQLFATQRRKR